MLGMIFTSFEDLVIEKFGLELWNEMLQNVNTESQGVFTKGAEYKDEDLVALLGYLSEKTALEIPTLLQTFGEYLFPQLIKSPPSDLSEIKSLGEFLSILDPIIHKEVKRLYTNSYLPKFEYLIEEGQHRLIYDSKRQLCDVAKGLLLGAAKYYKETATVECVNCQKDGHPTCTMIIKEI